jgi:uncharacterized peroxidase-related enzyme
MTSFSIYTPEDAPEKSRDTLESIKSSYGFIPNIYGIMAEAPSVLKAYLDLNKLLTQSSFSPTEQQILLLAVSAENNCDYCLAAHTTVAKGIKEFNLADAEGIKGNQDLSDDRLNTLVSFTRKFVKNRGFLEQSEIDNFLAQGFTKQQLLEVILAVSMKTLSNYVNHVAHTPVDKEFGS